MDLSYFLIQLYKYSPAAVERFTTLYSVIIFLIIADTILKLFSLTVLDQKIWHYKTIINVLWGGWGKEKSSRVFFRGFMFKFIEYTISCSVAFAIDIVHGPKEFPFPIFNIIAWLIYTAIVFTELASLLENYRMIKYNRSILSKLTPDDIEYFGIDFLKDKVRKKEKHDD